MVFRLVMLGAWFGLLAFVGQCLFPITEVRFGASCRPGFAVELASLRVFSSRSASYLFIQRLSSRRDPTPPPRNFYFHDCLKSLFLMAVLFFRGFLGSYTARRFCSRMGLGEWRILFRGVSSRACAGISGIPIGRGYDFKKHLTKFGSSDSTEGIRLSHAFAGVWLTIPRSLELVALIRFQMGIWEPEHVSGVDEEETVPIRSLTASSKGAFPMGGSVPIRAIECDFCFLPSGYPHAATSTSGHAREDPDTIVSVLLPSCRRRGSSDPSRPSDHSHANPHRT